MNPKLPEPSERRSDSQQLVRQWALLRLLSNATVPYSVKQLAEQLRTTKSTIERDLATLERNFALIEEQAGKQKKVYRVTQTVKELESLTFGITELLALYAAHAALVGVAGTPIHDDLVAVMTKIRGLLSKHHNGGLEALVRVFAPHARGVVDYTDQRELIDDLTDAIARRRVCELTYRAAGKEVDRTHRTCPLRLVWHRSARYSCSRSSAPRFRVGSRSPTRMMSSPRRARARCSFRPGARCCSICGATARTSRPCALAIRTARARSCRSAT